ncbi:MAG: hypothetical protein ACPGNV_15980 [Mangrovicoccus sp.]
MSRLEIFLLCMMLAACSGPDPLEIAGIEGTGYDVIEDIDEFQEHVVGQTLRGSGYWMEVLTGGRLRGQYLGETFYGTWSFRDGIFCQRINPAAASQSCYWIAYEGEDLRLIPAVVEG